MPSPRLKTSLAILIVAVSALFAKSVSHVSPDGKKTAYLYQGHWWVKYGDTRVQVEDCKDFDWIDQSLEFRGWSPDSTFVLLYSRCLKEANRSGGSIAVADYKGYKWEFLAGYQAPKIDEENHVENCRWVKQKQGYCVAYSVSVLLPMSPGYRPGQGKNKTVKLADGLVFWNFAALQNLEKVKPKIVKDFKAWVERDLGWNFEEEYLQIKPVVSPGTGYCYAVWIETDLADEDSLAYYNQDGDRVEKIDSEE